METFGYNPSTSDSQLLQSIFIKVDRLEDTDRERLMTIHEKLGAYKDAFVNNQKAHYLVNELYMYIDNSLYAVETRTVTSSSNTSLDDAIVSSLADQF